MLPYWARFCILWIRLSPSPLFQSWLGCTETKIHRILWSDSIFFPLLSSSSDTSSSSCCTSHRPCSLPLLSIDPHPPIPRPVCIHCSWLSTLFFRLRPRCIYPGVAPTIDNRCPFLYYYHYFIRIFYKLLIFDTDPSPSTPMDLITPLTNVARLNPGCSFVLTILSMSQPRLYSFFLDHSGHIRGTFR